MTSSELFEELWRRVARLARPLVATRAKPLDATAPRARVFVLAPHPDDEACIAATICAHVDRGDEVAIVIATDGRASRQLGLGPEEMAARRRTEAEVARTLLEPHRWEWLGLRDLDFDEETLRERLSPFIRELQPDIVYAPSLIDGHPDHLRCARALARALPDRPVSVRIVQIQTPLTPVLVNLAVDGSAFEERALAVLEAYASQRHSWARTVRSKRYAASLYGGTSWVDELWEVPGDAYRGLHERSALQLEGLRPNAYRDPFVYLSGLRARRALLRDDRRR